MARACQYRDDPHLRSPQNAPGGKPDVHGRLLRRAYTKVNSAVGGTVMAMIVGVHGIAQQFKGTEILRTEWEPSLRDGVSLAGGALPEGTLACAAYGSIFRPPGNR